MLFRSKLKSMSERASDEGEEYTPIQLKHAIVCHDFSSTYDVLQAVSESPTVSKLVIEDTEYEDRYFLMRYVLQDGDRDDKIKNYFKALEQYTKSSFSPLDMIKVWRVETTRIPDANNEEELLVFFEWGEPDCIDLSRLTKMQTMKFLKNILDILETTCRITKITHGDVCLDNILLIGNQLKLGGWRPYFISAPEGESNISLR